MSEPAPPNFDDDSSEDPDAVVHSQTPIATTDAKDRAKIAQFVTTIKNAEQQVGEHIIQALQHADTVAVLTTVALGPDGQQRVISAALDPKRMQQVQEILSDAGEEREEEEPCLGFHCLVKPKSGANAKGTGNARRMDPPAQ
jgi:hypothetical protein